MSWQQDWQNQINSGQKTKQRLFADFPSYVNSFQEWERGYNAQKEAAAKAEAAEQQAAQNAAQQVEQKKQAEVVTKAKMAADQDQASLALKRKKGGPSAKGIFTSPLGLAANANLVRQTLGGM